MDKAISWLTDQWRAAGIRPGNMVLLHSSSKRTLLRLREVHAASSVDILLNSFLAALGPEGTLLLPLFNFGFTSGKPFDIRHTPSQMGALTESARRRPGAVRTGHPIYSFAALGAQAELFRGVDNESGYGSDSPFAILHRSGGKIAVLDLPDQHSMTFYHYVEEQKSVSYRFYKSFTQDYTSADGLTAQRTYSLFVRDIDRGVLTDVNPMGERLWSLGLYQGHRPLQDSGLRVIDSADLFAATAAVIDDGQAEGLLYRVAL